jgi:hypothetical protein
MANKIAAINAVLIILVVEAGGFTLLQLQKPSITNNVPDPAMAHQYWVSVTSADAEVPRYTATGQNWTLTFAATWSYGPNAGQPIQNANATIQVTAPNSAAIEELTQNTTTGMFSFNYSATHAGIFKFNVTKLVTVDGTEWNTTLYDATTTLFGLHSETLTVWYDTFHAKLVEYNTNTLGITQVSVNVTYLLLPEDGLTLPSWATYSNQTFLPKTVHDAEVTVNGVAAQETSTSGIYTASISTWQPTSYLLVQVSQPKWLSTQAGFSVTHNANATVWTYALVFTGVAILGIAAACVFRSRKTHGTGKTTLRNFPFLGGILLSVVAVVSLYWGLTGLDGTAHGFDWSLLTIFGLLSFTFTLSGAIMSLRKKHQSLTISSAIAPLVLMVVLKAALDEYALATPWLEFTVMFVFIFLGGVLICNSDDQFKN